jgi:hypothetical protein
MSPAIDFSQGKVELTFVVLTNQQVLQAYAVLTRAEATGVCERAFRQLAVLQTHTMAGAHRDQSTAVPPCTDARNEDAECQSDDGAADRW